MPTEHLAAYVAALRASAGVGTAETSYYPALSALMGAVGQALKPKVHCVIHPASRGSGLPDGALFEQRGKRDPLPSALDGSRTPERGVIEAKPFDHDLEALAASEQVGRYLAGYGQVLLTNFHSFQLVRRGERGERVLGEHHALAPTGAELLRLRPADLAQREQPLLEYLTRVLLTPVGLSDPKDLAWFLASYARDALARVEQAEVTDLDPLRTALGQALGVSFEGEKGEHFFRSTLVQTLFYGLFSAWVLWSRSPQGATGRFNWREANWSLHIPFIRDLYESITGARLLRHLGVVELLDWTGEALNRVDRPAFFSRFQDEQAVQYFYEPFLEAFDPELREAYGVWYTPPEVVRYMVERVDRVLRTELDIPRGLADERVIVLDPACGTGAYVLEVLQRIHRTLEAEQPGSALNAAQVLAAAQRRIYGFELLPAPYVVAHLQLGLLLSRLGAALLPDDRLGVYLTNALIGWEPPRDQPRLGIGGYPALADEREAADAVKQQQAILVILGNPPYNSYAGIAVDEERALSEAYRSVRRVAAPQGQGLNDLYVRFFRMAERRIVERSGRGVICYISNYSWLDGLSHTGMRERFLEVFDSIWIDNLHGDRIISEYAPDGRTSETVFAMPSGNVGIKVGTAITTLVRQADHSTAGAQLNYRDLDAARAADRRRDLIESLEAGDFEGLYAPVAPELALGLPFKPRAVSAAYLTWPLLPELFPTSFPGVKTSRDDVVVNVDRPALEARLRRYFDPAVSHETLARELPGAMEDSARFNAKATRETLLARGYDAGTVMPYAYRPLDNRWLYWEPATKLLDEKRADYLPHVFEGNQWLSAGQRNRKNDFYQPQVTPVVADHHVVESNVYMFPLVLAETSGAGLFETLDARLRLPSGRYANLSPRALAALEALGLGLAEHAELFYHTLAVLHAPAYCTANAGALRQDWPRVPLPPSAEALRASAALGRQLAALLDPQQAAAGVSAAPYRPELRRLGMLLTTGAPTPDLALTAGWGHGGGGRPVMPARGRTVARAPSADELADLRAGLAALGLSEAQAEAALGARRLDVYLNATTLWSGVPEAVWEFTLGGYPVLKKWLSYREQGVLGRALRADEAGYFAEVVRRLSALCLLQPALDANYQRLAEPASGAIS